eukprot:15455398-Alexandrium_andersonii.AAC.1
MRFAAGSNGITREIGRTGADCARCAAQRPGAKDVEDMLDKVYSGASGVAPSSSPAPPSATTTLLESPAASPAKGGATGAATSPCGPSSVAGGGLPGQPGGNPPATKQLADIVAQRSSAVVNLSRDLQRRAEELDGIVDTAIEALLQSDPGKDEEFTPQRRSDQRS